MGFKLDLVPARVAELAARVYPKGIPKRADNRGLYVAELMARPDDAELLGLRLHEARRLMLFQEMDASGACRRVGYLSPSQFSREYSRFFGNAPTRDITRLREEGFAGKDGAC